MAGKGWLSQRGYRWRYIGKGKVKKEHRLFMEQYLGRPLRPDEVVHHIDGNRSNNTLANLQLLTRRKHNVTAHSKLLLKDIPVIRHMLRDGIKQHLIAFAFGVNRRTINDINCGRTWPNSLI